MSITKDLKFYTKLVYDNINRELPYDIIKKFFWVGCVSDEPIAVRPKRIVLFSAGTNYEEKMIKHFERYLKLGYYKRHHNNEYWFVLTEKGHEAFYIAHGFLKL